MELWKKWSPLPDLPNRLYLERLVDDQQGLTLVLSDEGSSERLLRIVFDGPLAYRNADESDRIAAFANIEDLGHWPLYTVEQSDFAHWLEIQSSGVKEAKNLKHFSVVTPNDIVDILDLEAPTLDWIARTQDRTESP